jgi:hypothetical protein
VLAAAVLLLMPLVLAIFVTLKVLLPSLHPTRRLRPAALFLSKGSVCSFWRLELEFVLEGLLLLVFLVELSMSIAPTASANVSRLYCCGICCCGLAVEGRVEFEFEIMREILGYGPCNIIHGGIDPCAIYWGLPQPRKNIDTLLYPYPNILRTPENILFEVKYFVKGANCF